VLKITSLHISLKNRNVIKIEYGNYNEPEKYYSFVRRLRETGFKHMET
jgi:hypothetical protein